MLLQYVGIGLLVVFGLFVFVIAFGAPYLPTLNDRTRDVVELLDLKPGQTFLELGCGDGRVLKAAAKQGVKGYGYELNPILVLIAKWNNRKYKGMVHIRMADYWTSNWPPVDGIYVFLLQKYMTKLDKKIIHSKNKWNKGQIRLVSFAFQIESRKHVQERRGMYVYDYLGDEDISPK